MLSKVLHVSVRVVFVVLKNPQKVHGRFSSLVFAQY